jgi:hypothetical protein
MGGVAGQRLNCSVAVNDAWRPIAVRDTLTNRREALP